MNADILSIVSSILSISAACSGILNGACDHLRPRGQRGGNP